MKVEYGDFSFDAGRDIPHSYLGTAGVVYKNNGLSTVSRDGAGTNFEAKR
jgi:hypothetical protein